MSCGSHTSGGNLGNSLIWWLLISVHPSAVGYFQSIMSLRSLKIFKIAIRCEPYAHASYLNIFILLEATCMSRLQLIAHDLYCSHCWFTQTVFCWSNVKQINTNLSILYEVSGLILHRLVWWECTKMWDNYIDMKLQHRYAPHNDVLVNDGLHIRQCSHKIVIL